MMKNIFIFLICSLLLVCCNSKIENEKPVREISLPKDAFFVGNSESGNWFEIEEINNYKMTFKISIYSGRNGVRLSTKKYILACSKKNQVSIENLKNEIKFYDGSKIYLKNGCWLK